MTAIQATSYDEVPYTSYAFPECHPDRMATVATLYGLEPPSVGECRLLEIGCAGGGNLIPLAFAMPKAQFVGIDLSPRQIAEAQAHVDALGLENVGLHALSLTDVGDDFGRFDYIICHGVYSWVPRRVQDAILEACRRRLNPDGVAYVSYNTFPGWHFAGMIREMMLYHVRRIPEPERRVREARDLIELLIAAIPEKNSLYGQIFRLEAERLRPQTDSYLLHEHLEEENQPLYFHEFIERASAHGLNYLGDARYRTSAECQPADVKATLDRLAQDLIGREQYVDFLRNKTFRRSLLCQADRHPRPSFVPESLERLRATAACGPANPVPDLHSGAPEEFRSPDGQFRLSTNSPVIKMGLMILCELWPRSLPISELRAQVHNRLDRPPAPNAAPFDRAPQALQHGLIQAFTAGLVELSIFEPAFATTVSPRPIASRLVRRQADTGRRVVNFRHRNVELSEFERLVVRNLDGRDEAGLIDALWRAVADGSFLLHQDGRPITDQAVARPILARSVPPCLQRLAGSALLEG